MAVRSTQRRGWRIQLLPARLSARVTASIMITGTVVFVLMAIAINATLAFYTRSLATIDSAAQLSEIRSHLDLQARELDALIVGFAERDAFYRQTSSPDPAFISTEFDPWLSSRAAAEVVVWASSDGTIISSNGSAADINALLEIGRGHPAGASGPIILPSGPAVVSVRPVIGDPPAGSVGTLAVARTITSEVLARGGVRGITIAPDELATSEGDGWRDIGTPVGYDSAVYRVADGRFLTHAILKGLSGEPAVGLEISRPDPWLGEGHTSLIVLVTLGLGVVTLGIGYLLGTSLGRSIGRPLHRFVTYLQDQGYLALQGLRTDEELVPDPFLSDDFTRLGQVITDLMTQLRINQAELMETGDQALAAELAFRTVVEESPEVKILVRGGVVEIANPAAAHFLGLQLGDLLRAEPDGLFSGVELFDEQGDPLELTSVARQARNTPVVARCVAPEQPDRWIEVSVAFIDATGVDYVISARNITEERRLEALREEVMSLVSHDLRSPLTVVRGYLDILDRPLDEERRASAIESARRATIRMEDLLDDLLHATRAERVFAPRVMRPIDLATLVVGITASMQMGAEQRIVASVAPGVTVLGDAVRLEQAVTNLVGNAIKHGPPQGEIRVEVAARSGRAVISVEDGGPGILANHRERLFERGARGSQSHGTPGMGLGLYIVRVVAEAHGGLAFIEDSPAGTRFVLDLPLMIPDPESA